MSERKDIENNLPTNKIENPTLVYRSKRYINTFNNAIHYLLNNSLIYRSNSVTINSDWNKLQLNSISRITNWNGKHAPALEGQSGIVITFGNDIYHECQIAFGEGKLATRKVGENWVITNGSDKEAIEKLSNTLNDMDNLINSYQNAQNSENDLLAHQITENSNTEINDNNSLAAQNNLLSMSTSSNNVSLSSNIQNLNNIKEDKTSEASDVNHINQVLATKVNITDGEILDPDLNKDTKIGRYNITNEELSHDPETTSQNHDNGLLTVTKIGNNNILQILYETLGNSDNISGNSYNTDGAGTISYRFLLFNHGYSTWQPWRTIPYQKDFNYLKKETAKSTTSLNNKISNAATFIINKANNQYNSYSNEINSNLNSEASYVNSNFDTTESNINNAKAYTLSKETEDYNTLNDNLDSTEVTLQNSASIEAASAADSIATSIASEENDANSSNSTNTAAIRIQMGGIMETINDIQNSVNTSNTTNHNALDRLKKDINNKSNDLYNISNQNFTTLSNSIRNVVNKEADLKNNITNNYQNAISSASSDNNNYTNIQFSNANISLNSYSEYVKDSVYESVSSIEDRLGTYSDSIKQAKDLINNLKNIKDINKLNKIGSLINQVKSLKSTASNQNSEINSLFLLLFGKNN